MAKGDTLNQAAMGDQGRSTAEAMDQLSGRIHSLMKERYKGDSKKANVEAEALIAKMLANGKTLQSLEKKSLSQRLKDEASNAKEIAKLQRASATDFKGKLSSVGTSLKAASKEMGANLLDASKKAAKELANNLVNLGAAFDSNIESMANMYGQYSSKINARLQTVDEYGGQAFEGLSKLIRKNLAASPYLKQKEMLESLDSLIAQGISYNVEQRAFLATMTNKVVTTFNALDGTLTRMVRLQQQDTTQARMGMEAQLTQYFNSTYQDTSYLNNAYDTVTENLFEASSQLGRNASIELEYVVQKWLGSMSSVGVGDTFITNIAQGLGYLGSGNVDALSSNAALQNLLVMAANRSGVDYSGVLSQGLNADTANKLLSGIASYVNEISQSNNQVVKSQYAQLFGMSLSDMTAMLNLTSEDLVSISQNMLSYGDTIDELEKQLASVGSRMYLSEKMGNVFDNFMTSVAGNIVGSAGQYITWKVTDLVEKATGGIAIPTIMAFGSGIDLNTTVTGLMKTGIVGANIIGQIGNILTGLSTGKSLSLDAWAGEESISRGSGLGAITSGYQKTTSTSTYIGSSSGSDIYSSSVASAKDQAIEENKGNEPEENINDLTKTIIEILRKWDSENGVKIHLPDYMAYNLGAPINIDKNDGNKIFAEEKMSIPEMLEKMVSILQDNGIKIDDASPVNVSINSPIGGVGNIF